MRVRFDERISAWLKGIYGIGSVMLIGAVADGDFGYYYA